MNDNIPLSKIIVKNSFFRIANFVSKFLIAFVITPYMVHRLGMELFGVWTILSVVVTYAHLSDMGIGRTLIIFVSKYHSKGDIKALSEIITSALGMYVIFGGFSFLVLYFAQPFLINNIFKIPLEFAQDAFFVYKGVLAIFLFNLVFSVFQSTINGLQRMEITNTIKICTSIINAVGIFIVLELGYGIKGLIITSGVTSLIGVLSNYYFFRRITTRIKFFPLIIKKTRIKEILKFSINVELSYIFRMLLDPLNKILIGYFGSLSMLTYYEIGWKIISLIIGLFRSLMGSILPALTKVATKDGSDSVKYLFHYSSKYVSFLAIPGFALVFILSRHFIEAWMGPGFETSIVTLQILIFPYLINILMTPAMLSIQAIGFPKYAMRLMFIRGLLNLILGYIFILLFGYIGLIVAHAIAVIISAMYMEIIFHRIIRASMKKTFLAIFNKINIINVVVSFLFFSMINYINPRGYINLILWGITYLGFSSSLMFIIHWLDEKDRQILKSILPAPIYSKLT